MKLVSIRFLNKVNLISDHQATDLLNQLLAANVKADIAPYKTPNAASILLYVASTILLMATLYILYFK